MKIVLSLLILVLLGVSLSSALITPHDACKYANPCKNGKCALDYDGNVICNCDYGYTGRYCDKKEDHCNCGLGESCIHGFCFPDFPTSCAAVTCIRGQICKIIDGVAQCVDPCATVRCRKGYKCVVKNGQAKCEIIDRCPLMFCPEHKPLCKDSVCYSPCATVRCRRGYQCVIENGQAKCEKVDQCPVMYCPKDKPLCKDSVCYSLCDHHNCEPDVEKCVIKNGKPYCELIDQCPLMFCPKDKPVCKDSVCYNPCDRARCPEKCIVKNAEALCVPGNYPCNLVDCAPETPVCEVRDEEPVCFDPCSLVLCPKDKPRCIIENRQAKCVSPCIYAKCGHPKPICIVHNGQAKCVGCPPSLNFLVCSGLTSCYDHAGCKPSNHELCCKSNCGRVCHNLSA